MPPQIINYVCLGILLAFLLFGMFWGIIRGFKKSLFRGLWLLALALILFFLTPVIGNWLCKFDLGFIHISINGEPLTNLYDTVYTMLMKNEQIADLINQNPSLLPLVEEMVILIINTFLFPILFWVFKIATYPIWFIISAIVFRRKKQIVNGKKKKIKVKKHRFVGLLLGTVTGAMVMIVTLMPITGTISLVKEIDSIEYSGGKNGEGIVTTLVGNEVMGYIDTYDEGILGSALKYTGLKAVSNGMYNFLSTKKIDNQKVSLKEELSLYVQLYSDVNLVSTTDFNKINKEELSKVLNSSERLIKNLFSSKVVKIAGDDLITYAFNMIESNESFNKAMEGISVQELKELAKASVNEIKTSNVSTLQQDLLNVVYICKSLNDNDVLIPIIKKEVSKPTDYLNLITDRVIDEVSKYMFKMPSVNKVYPIAINKGLSYVGRMLNFTYTEKDFSGSNLLQEDFANILKGGFAVARTLNFDTKYFVTKSSFESVGQFLDTIKNLNILQDGVFENIVTKSIDKGIEYLEKQQFDVKIKNLVKSAVDKIEQLVVNKTTLLKNEFKQYGILFDDVKEIINDFKNTNKESLVLKKYGALLDKLNKTSIFKELVPDVIETGWDMVKDKVSSLMPTSMNVTKIVETIKNNVVLVLRNQNINNPTISSPSNIQLSMEVEFENMQELYSFICTNILSYFKQGGTGFDGLVDDLFNESSELFTNLGVEFDKLNTKNNLVLSNDVLKLFVAGALNFVTEETTTNESVNTFLSGIVTNVENVKYKVSWEKEFGNFKTLMNVATKEIDLNTIGKTLDKVCDSNFITYTLINNLLKDQIQSKYESMDAASINETTDEIIEKIKTNLNNIVTKVYEQEITHMLNLMDLISNSNSKSFVELGQDLDSFNSSVVIADVRPLMINYALDKKLEDNSLNATVIKALNRIKTNVANIPSSVANNFYELELTGLESIVNINFPQSKDELTNAIMLDIGTKLYNISNTKLSYNLGELVVDAIFDFVNFEDITSVLTSINTRISGANGILANNRKDTTLNSDIQNSKQEAYIACFTDLFSLVNTYDSVSNAGVTENASGTTIGDGLETIATLSIIQGEDKEIANIILNKFEDNAKEKVNTIKQQKIDEVNANTSLSQADKMTAIATINAKADAFNSQVETSISNAKDNVTNKTKSYTIIFNNMINEMKVILENAETEINA